MTGPNQNGDRYRRRYPNPEQWESEPPPPQDRNEGAFCPDAAVEVTRAKVNDLSWELLADQTAANAAAWSRAPQLGDEVEAHLARMERREQAWAAGWQAGEPGA